VADLRVELSHAPYESAKVTTTLHQPCYDSVMQLHSTINFKPTWGELFGLALFVLWTFIEGRCARRDSNPH